MRLVRISLLAMTLGALALAGCGGADDPADTTPATNDGVGASVGGGVQAGDTEVEGGAAAEVDEDGASVGGEIEAGDADQGNEGMQPQPQPQGEQQPQPQPQPRDPSQPHPMPQPSPTPAPTPTPTPAPTPTP